MGCNGSWKGARIVSMLAGVTILLNTPTISRSDDKKNSTIVSTSLTMKREEIKGNAVFGRLLINGEFVCYTLENREKMIPPGTYKVTRTNKGFRLVGVQGRSNINIEIGNYPFESLGCVFVGMTRNSKGVFGSKRTLFKLIRLVSLPASLTIS